MVSNSEFSFHVMTNSLVVSLDGKNHVLMSSDPRYSEVLRAIMEAKDKKGAVKDILLFQEPSPRLKVVPEKQALFIDDKEVPAILRKKYLELRKSHKPRTHLIKFWDKLQKNPSEHSQAMLYKFLEHNGHPILPGGDFIAYKSIREDWKDHHSGTIENKVGRVVKMPREQVTADPESLCSSGLHCGSWAYISTFGGSNSRFVEVSVNPADVVSVPLDAEGTKMRVERYKVLRQVQKQRQDKIYAENIIRLQNKIKRELAEVAFG